MQKVRTEQMRVVHRGFDTITLAIEARLPEALFEYLKAEKERAADAREPVEVSYNGVTLHLEGHGGKGYRFIVKDTPVGATWFFKKPRKGDPWGVRLTLGSTMLATQGLGHARAYVVETMDRLGMPFEAHQVSIARVDFCVDILAPDFELRPENFVIHSNATRRDHIKVEAYDDIRCFGAGDRTQSVTIGASSGRQAIIYDKRAEVIKRHKDIWWTIWNRNLENDGLPPLDTKDPIASRVWRIEMRSGPNLLKRTWQMKTWADFDRRLGDVLAESFATIRYADPAPSDRNRSRWPNHPIWSLAATETEGDLAEMRTYLERDNVREVYREKQIRLMFDQVLGSSITLAALRDSSLDELDRFFMGLGREFAEEFRQDRARIGDKLATAKSRYRFI